MPIVVNHTVDPQLLTQVIASGLAREITKRDEAVAFDQADRATRTDLIGKQQDLSERRFGYDQQNDVAQRQHANDILRLQSDLWGQRDEAQLKQLPRELEIRNNAALAREGKQFSLEQQRALDGIASARQRLRTSPNFKPEYAARMEAQLDESEMQIISAGAISAASPYAKNQQPGMSWMGPDGATYSRGMDGEVRQHPPTMKPADFFKAMNDYIAANTTYDPVTKAEKKPSFAEARVAIGEAMREYQGYVRGMSGQGEEQQSQFIGPTAPGMGEPQQPAMQQEQMVAGPQPTVPQIAAAVQEKMRQEMIFPPNHWLNNVDPASVFQGRDGNTYTAGDIAQIAQARGIQVDRVLDILVEPTQQQQGVAASAATGSRPGFGELREGERGMAQTYTPPPPSEQEPVWSGFGGARERESGMSQERGYMSDPVTLRPVGQMMDEFWQRGRERHAQESAANQRERAAQLSRQNTRPYRDVPAIRIPLGADFDREMRARGYSDRAIAEFYMRRKP